METTNLPKLSNKESDFVELYWFGGVTGTEAYSE